MDCSGWRHREPIAYAATLTHGDNYVISSFDLNSVFIVHLILSLLMMSILYPI